MSVTVEDIVAAHGHIACGIRETQDNRELGARGNSRFPLPYCLATGRILMVIKSRTQTGCGA
jgi:hypothetical protein